MKAALRALVPWHTRIAAKLLLARAPIPYEVWRKMNLFRHGAMTDSAYAGEVFGRHLAALPSERRTGFTALELGPGDSLLSVVLARLAGASRTWCIDAGAFATANVSFYREVAQRLITDRSNPGISPGTWRTMEDMLADCGGVYLTGGLASLRDLPDASVDLSWSQAVLEHIRREEFQETIDELHRVMRPGAASSHQVDLRDHLGGALNNLRFSRERWESPFFSGSGFYTNRIRFAEMIACFREADFKLDLLEPHSWDAMPTPRHRMDPEFRSLPDEDLRVADFYVLLRA